MGLASSWVEISIECIIEARKQGVNNWLEGIISDEIMEKGLIAERENRNGPYQKLINEIQKKPEVDN